MPVFDGVMRSSTSWPRSLSARSSRSPGDPAVHQGRDIGLRHAHQRAGLSVAEAALPDGIGNPPQQLGAQDKVIRILKAKRMECALV